MRGIGLMEVWETRCNGACCLVDDRGDVLGFGDAGPGAPTDRREDESLDIMDGEGRALKFLRKLLRPLTWLSEEGGPPPLCTYGKDIKISQQANVYSSVNIKSSVKFTTCEIYSTML